MLLLEHVNAAAIAHPKMFRVEKFSHKGNGKRMRENQS